MPSLSPHCLQVNWCQRQCVGITCKRTSRCSRCSSMHTSNRYCSTEGASHKPGRQVRQHVPTDDRTRLLHAWSVCHYAVASPTPMLPLRTLCVSFSLAAAPRTLKHVESTLSRRQHPCCCVCTCAGALCWIPHPQPRTRHHNPPPPPQQQQQHPLWSCPRCYQAR